MVFRGVFYDLSGGGYEETLLLYVSAGAGSNETLARMPPIAIASRPAVFPGRGILFLYRVRTLLRGVLKQ
jgi:hypothetical protein